MCMGGGSSGGGTTTTTFTPEKQKGFEGDILGTGGAIYDQLLYSMGYERTPAPQRDFAAEIADLQKQANDAKSSGDTAGAKAFSSQIKDLEKQQKSLSKSYGKYGATPFTLQQRALTPEEQQQKDYEAALTKKYQDTIMGGTVPQDVQDYIGTMFNTRQDEVQRQIDQAATNAASSRGLGLSDTPMANPYLRTTAEAAQNLRGQQAQALLGARSEELNRAGGYMSYLDTLKQLKNFQNPMSLGGAYANFGLGLQSNRYKAGTTTSTTSGGGISASGLGGLLQGGGGFLSGLKTAGLFG